MTLDSIRKLSDTEVISGLEGLSSRQREIGAEIVAHLVIIRERNIHLDMSYSSLVEYCVGRLGCSKDVAYKWTAAVKVAEAHPGVLGWLAAGEITASALAALAPHSGDADLVARSRGRSRRQIRMMCAAKYPRKSWSRIQFRVRPVVDGLSKIEMTVPNALLEQLEAALDLDSQLDPVRDPVALLSRAVATYLDTRRDQHQRATDRPSRVEATETVPVKPVRNADESSGASCIEASPEGRGRTARAPLELHHIEPRARGGASDRIRVDGSNHTRHAAETQVDTTIMKAARRSQVARNLAATLKRRSRRVARRAAAGAVDALSVGAPMELLFKEALQRVGRSSKASPAAQAAPRWDPRGSSGSEGGPTPTPRRRDNQRAEAGTEDVARQS
jgi:hypothetical protein